MSSVLDCLTSLCASAFPSIAFCSETAQKTALLCCRGTVRQAKAVDAKRALLSLMAPMPYLPPRRGVGRKWPATCPPLGASGDFECAGGSENEGELWHSRCLKASNGKKRPSRSCGAR